MYTVAAGRKIIPAFGLISLAGEFLFYVLDNLYFRHAETELIFAVSYHAFFYLLLFSWYHHKNTNNEKNQLKFDSRYLFEIDKLKNRLISISGIEKITTTLVSFINSHFKTTDVRLFLWNEEKGYFSSYPDTSERHLPIYHPFLIWLTDNEYIFCKKDFETNPRYDVIKKDAIDFFNITGSDYIVPFLLNQSLIGFTVINSSADLDFTDYDRLNEIRSTAVSAISNTILYERATSLAETLEQKVRDRTRELEETQAQLVMSEKMASLGIMVSGVAHEINTPSAIITGAADNLELFAENTLFNNKALEMIHTNPRIREKVNAILSASFAAERQIIGSAEKFRKKKQLKETILQSGIEPEPAGKMTEYILHYGLDDRIEDLTEVVRCCPEILDFTVSVSGIFSNIAHIRYAIRNITRIVNALKHYSHIDQASREYSDINEGIENTLVIMHNQLKNGITIKKEFGDIPKTECYPDELNQVWTNLVLNGAQSMGYKGTICISTASDDKNITVRISDTGPGIRQENAERIWDPFFTTKKQGEGTGLGLVIVKKIVERHNGTIRLTSHLPGKTEFTVTIPVVSGSM